MIKAFIKEFHNYRSAAEKAFAQLSDEALNHVPTPDANSVAMLARHMSGNLRSRFTEFLTTDGEKPWRDRDAEFEERQYSRDEMHVMWADGWRVLDDTLASLTDADLSRTVHLRGDAISVHEALCRALAHMSYHTGQIVLLARMLASGEWNWITIPKKR